ncbi:torso-like protein [Venturia canescens]|uniref:torso-like protein n=1 Tax=Venturia canescens TaxID=32260 RepID=UPI001C9C15EC|nr:torso-like protein [Venturia canescens]
MLRERSGKNREVWIHGSLLLFVLTAIMNIEGAIRKPQLGESIAVFGGFQHLDELIMRNFIHRGENAQWHNTGRVNVFKHLSVAPRPLNKKRTSTFSTRNIQVKLCKDIDTLLKTYFSNFYIEGIHKPWRALIEDWSAAATAERFGIDASYLTSDYSFGLLRIARGRDSQKIGPSMSVKDDVVVAVKNLVTEGISGFAEILFAYGSHYVTSYITGNSLYQVFVYERSQYDFIASEVNTRGINGLSELELNLFFSPWMAVHQGKILTASENSTVEAWAAKNLVASEIPTADDSTDQIHSLNGASPNDWIAEHLLHPSKPISLPSLIHLHKNRTLLQTLGNLLLDEAFLALRLEILSFPIEDTKNSDLLRKYCLLYLLERDSLNQHTDPGVINGSND